MNKIDFYQEKVSLHNRMVKAIKELMEEKGVKSVDLQEGCDSAYAVKCCDESACEAELSVVWIERDVLWAETTAPDMALSLESGGDVLLASIDTVYGSVCQKLSNM